LLTNRLTRRLKPTWLIIGESVVGGFPCLVGRRGRPRLNLRTNLSQVGSRCRRHCATGRTDCHWAGAARPTRKLTVCVRPGERSRRKPDGGVAQRLRSQLRSKLPAFPSLWWPNRTRRFPPRAAFANALRPRPRTPFGRERYCAMFHRIAKCGRNTVCGGRIYVSVERRLKR